MKIRKINEKKGLSEMISYVLLIAIAIGISTGVFVWLKSYTNVKPVVDCEEGTSVLMESYSCGCTAREGCLIKLELKNNGRFNVSGIILTVSNDSREPSYNLVQATDVKKLFVGYQFFIPQLSPGSSTEGSFINTLKNNNVLDKITSIKIQPFIIIKQTKVVCQNSIIKQPITCNF